MWALRAFQARQILQPARCPQLRIRNIAYTAQRGHSNVIHHIESSRTRWTSLKIPRRTIQHRYNSTKQSPEITSQLGSPQPQLGLKEKLKQLFKQYGWLSVGVYMTFSALDFPFCFLAVRLAGPERIGQIEHQLLTSLKGYTEPVWKVVEPVLGPAVHAVSSAAARMKDGAVKTAGMDSGEVDVEVSGPASIWTQLALAYGIHKTLLIFVRVPLTAAFTPKIARMLQKRGWKIGSSKAP